MTGTVTRYKKKDRSISWGFYFKVDNAQYTKSGFESKGQGLMRRASARFARRRACRQPPTRRSPIHHRLTRATRAR